MKHISFIIIVLLGMTISSRIQAQEVNVDSLENIIKQDTSSVTSKIEAYWLLTSHFDKKNLELQLKYATEGFQLAKKSKNIQKEAVFTEYIGRYYMYINSLDTAMQYLDKAFEIAGSCDDIDTKLSTYITKSSVLSKQKQIDKSLELLFSALTIAEEANSKTNQMKILANIAAYYGTLHATDQAIEYSERTIKMAEELNQLPHYAVVFINLSMIYKSQMNFEKSFEYAQKGYNYSVETKSLYYQCAALQELAIASVFLKNYDKAVEYSKQSIEIAEQSGLIILLHTAYNTMSSVYLEMNMPEKSEPYAYKAWQIDTTNLQATRDVLISNIALANTDKALEFMRLFNEGTAKYLENALIEKTIEMSQKYETEKKELQIISLLKEKKLYIWLGVIGLGLLITVVCLFIYHHRLSRQKIRHLEQEKQLAAAEAVIDGESSERARLARDLHDGLGGMLSAVKINLTDIENLHHAREMLDNSIEELRRVAHHLMPASLLRFGMKASLDDYCNSFPNVHFHYFGEDRRIAEKIEILVYRCVYELVNNAVKHAQAPNINVQLVLHDDRLALTVQDDGRGFDINETHEGMGLENLRTRLAAFKGTMDVTSAPDEGTETNIELLL